MNTFSKNTAKRSAVSESVVAIEPAKRALLVIRSQIVDVSHSPKKEIDSV